MKQLSARVRNELYLFQRSLANQDYEQALTQIRQTEDLLAGMSETRGRYRTLKKLNLLILKLNTMRRGSAALDIPQHYVEQVVGRLDKKHANKA